MRKRTPAVAITFELMVGSDVPANSWVFHGLASSLACFALHCLNMIPGFNTLCQAIIFCGAGCGVAQTLETL